jgi:hypothetical protein
MKTYFTIAELNPRSNPITPEIETNMRELITRLSAFREAFGQPMIITSGLRSEADQKRIYAGKKSIPMRSCHLIGAAADVSDRDRVLSRFCLDNVPLLEKIGLWLESPERTPTWVHFQIFPPASKNRFFQP